MNSGTLIEQVKVQVPTVCNSYQILGTTNEMYPKTFCRSFSSIYPPDEWYCCDHRLCKFFFLYISIHFLEWLSKSLKAYTKEDFHTQKNRTRGLANTDPTIKSNHESMRLYSSLIEQHNSKRIMLIELTMVLLGNQR